MSSTGGDPHSSLPSTAGAVVIGGGIVGCSAAYHLAKRGVKDVVLLEQGSLTGGTTWHSAGLVGQLRSDIGMTRLVQYGAQLVPELEAETGLSTGWKRCGSLTLARTQDRMVQLQRTAALAAAFGVEAQMVDTDHIGRVWDGLRTDDLLGGVWLPGDGKANPVDLTMAIVAAGRAHGVRFLERVEVERVLVQDGTAVGVRTAQGDVHAQVVVNAAGMWARELGARDGVDVPLHAVEHMYVVTSPMGIDPELPVIRDTDGRIYLKEEVAGLVVGGFEPDAKPFGTDGIPKPFEFSLLAEDWDQFGLLMGEAVHRVPKLEQVGISTFVNGPESFTPDNQFILGETPNIDRYFVAAGFNSTGIASGLGVGRALAEWIVAGEPDVDLHLVELQRFLPQHADEAFLRERVTEIPGLHYAVAYPHREFETARDVLHSPFHERMVAQGARLATRMLWERPIWFDPTTPPESPRYSFGTPEWFASSKAEHQGVRGSVGVIDMSAFTHVVVRGRDAASLILRVCAGRVDIDPGRTVYTPMLNRRGGIECDVTVTGRQDGSFLIVAGAGERTRCLARLRRVAQDLDVTITDATEGLATLGVMGPRSRDLLTEVLAADLSKEAFPYGRALETSVGGSSVLCLRTSYVGELGWELHLPVDQALQIYDQIATVGQRYDLVHAGAYAMDSLRLEVGMRAWGRELGPDVSPIEAGLGPMVREDPGYIGSDVVTRHRSEGASQRVLSLTVDDPDVLLFGHEPLRRDGRICGWTTSASYGHTLGRAVAFALIAVRDGVYGPGFLEGSDFTVQAGDRLVDVTVSEKRPLSPQWRRQHPSTGAST